MSRPRLYQTVAQQILELIEERGATPGAHLPNERELALALGVSRSTIREAEIALEAAGRIAIRPGWGVIICDSSANAEQAPVFDEMQLLEAMLVSLGETAALAALTAKPEQIDAIDTAYRAISVLDNSLVLDTEIQFYSTLGEVSCNGALREVIEQLLKSYKISAAHLLSEVEDRQRLAELLHKGLGLVMEAMHAGEGANARLAMRAHFRDLMAFRLEVAEKRAVAEIIARNRVQRERFMYARA